MAIPVKFLLAPFAMALAASAVAAPARKAPPPDLATVAAGAYHGDVISDARGSSRSDVMVTVTRTAPNTVSVTTSYSRFPVRTFRLTRAMNTIQNTGPGNPGEVFLLDLSHSPHKLDLTIDDASWSGEAH